MFTSLDDIRLIIKTLERVQNEFLSQKRTAESHARGVACGSALAGLIGGSCGLIISYSITAGITEGVTIPQIKADFVKQQNIMYISNFEKMYTNTEELHEELETKRRELIDIYSKLTTAGSLAFTLNGMPLGIHFTLIR